VSSVVPTNMKHGQQLNPFCRHGPVAIPRLVCRLISPLGLGRLSDHDANFDGKVDMRSTVLTVPLDSSVGEPLSVAGTRAYFHGE
jgi:hypothetical protein